jgi:hypothetical protein
VLIVQISATLRGVSTPDYEPLAAAGEVFLDALESSFPTWAEMVVERVESRVGAISEPERIGIVGEAERRLRAEYLDHVATIEASVHRLRQR